MLQLQSNHTRTMATNDYTVCSAAGTLYRAPNRLDLFDAINLARCAAERAKANVFDCSRWEGEWLTAEAWHGKRPTSITASW